MVRVLWDVFFCVVLTSLLRLWFVGLFVLFLLVWFGFLSTWCCYFAYNVLVCMFCIVSSDLSLDCGLLCCADCDAFVALFMVAVFGLILLTDLVCVFVYTRFL